MKQSRILIVSSDKVMAKLLEHALINADFEVLLVTDSARAKIQARKEKPDLLVIDLACADLDGCSLAQELRRVKFSSLIPILFLTISGEKKLRPFLPQLGVTDYVTKPFNPDEIVIRVKTCLRYSKGDTFQDMDGKSSIQGNLQEMTLIDLIQIFFQGKKEGHLIIDNGMEKAYIYFQAGNIINARVGNVLGVKALNRLFTWNTGNFEFFSGGVTCSNLINLSTENILLNGLNQIDEYNRIKDLLPSLNTRLRIMDSAGPPPENSTQAVREVLHNARFYHSIRELIDNCSETDLEVYRAISSLLKSGHLEVIKPEDEEFDSDQDEPLISYTQIVKVREMLEPFHHDDFKLLSGKIVIINHTNKLIQELFVALTHLNEFTPFSFQKKFPSDESHIGPLGFISLNDQTELSVFIMPTEISFSPLWSVFSNRVLGILVLIDSEELSSLITIRDSCNFFFNEMNIPGIIGAKIEEGKDVLTVVCVRKMLNLPSREKIFPVNKDPTSIREMFRSLLLRILSNKN